MQKTQFWWKTNLHRKLPAVFKWPFWFLHTEQKTEKEWTFKIKNSLVPCMFYFTISLYLWINWMSFPCSSQTSEKQNVEVVIIYKLKTYHKLYFSNKMATDVCSIFKSLERIIRLSSDKREILYMSHLFMRREVQQAGFLSLPFHLLCNWKNHVHYRGDLFNRKKHISGSYFSHYNAFSLK